MNGWKKGSLEGVRPVVRRGEIGKLRIKQKGKGRIAESHGVHF